MMLSPEDAFDLLTSPMEFSAWLEDQDLEFREARRLLGELAAPLFEKDAPPLESATLRRARRAQALRGNLGGRRRDVEEICAFADRAGRLPGRLKDVFELCFVSGLSHRECAERLGIATETVRAHLRRLRQLARSRGFGALDGRDFPQN